MKFTEWIYCKRTFTLTAY